MLFLGVSEFWRRQEAEFPIRRRVGLVCTVNSLYNELPRNDNLSITIIFHAHRKFV